MDKVMENVSDRELFSELVDNPINPLHVHIVPPFVKENNPMFYLQINGEAAFQVHFLRNKTSFWRNKTLAKLIIMRRSQTFAKQTTPSLFKRRKKQKRVVVIQTKGVTIAH